MCDVVRLVGFPFQYIEPVRGFEAIGGLGGVRWIRPTAALRALAFVLAGLAPAPVRLRPMCRVLLLLLLLGGAPISKAFAQPQGTSSVSSAAFVARTWTQADGLPSNYVHDVAQTSDGYLWIATASGLSRFDGIRFQQIEPENAAAWRTSHLSTLHVDRQGVLWVISILGDVGRIDRGRLRLVAPSPNGASMVHGSVYEDRHGHLWFGLEASGLAMVQEGEHRVYRTADGLPSEEVIRVQEDEAGTLWAITKGGRAQWRGDRFVAEGREVSNFVRPTWYQTPDGAWWEAIEGRLEPFDPIRFGLARGSSPEQFFTFVGPIRPGVAWYITPRGVVSRSGSTVTAHPPLSAPLGEYTLYAYHRDGVAFIPRRTQGVLALWWQGSAYSVPLGNGAQYVSSGQVHQDPEGNIWLGTDVGLVRLTPRKAFEIGLAQGLPSRFVWSVRPSRDGSVWIGMHRGGLARLTPDGRVTRLRVPQADPAESYRTILEDRTGRVWAGGNAQLGTVRVQENGGLEGFGERGVTVLHEDLQGTLWLGRGGGIERVEFAPNGTPRFVPIFSEGGDVHDFANLPDGRLLAATGSGLYVREAEAWRPFLRPNGEAFPSTMRVMQEADGDLWISTRGNGLYRLRSNDNLFLYTAAAHGLVSDGIWWMQDDQRGFYWLLSDAGVQRVPKADFDAVANGTRERLRGWTITEAEGMPSVEGAAGKPAGFLARDGRLWFSTVNGIAIIDPTRFPDTAPIPPVVIEAVAADGIWSDSLAVRHPRGTRNLSFRFTALSFTRPEAIQFRYRLEGVNERWIYADTRRETFYTNLSPGRYTFHVQATSLDGVWGEEGAAYTFVIAAHWWQTPWFILLMTMLLGGGIALGWRYRENRLRTVELEREVHVRTRELQEKNAILTEQRAEIEAQKEQMEVLDRLKTSFFQNVTHEFRTPLQLILGPTRDILASAELEPRVRQLLETVERNGHRLHRLVDQLLTLARLDGDGLKLDRRPGDLAVFAAEVVRAHIPLAERAGVALEFQSHDAPLVVAFDGPRLEMLLSNIISNAVKFTQAGGRVRVIACRGDGRAIVRVIDSGIGIPPEALPHVFERFYQVDAISSSRSEGVGIGLALAQELARLHHGEITAQSELGFGSTFTLTLPLYTETSAAPAEAEPHDHLGHDLASAPNAIPLNDLAHAAKPIVLVVDDNPDMRHFLRVILHDAFHVMEAEGGAEAIALLRESRPDALVTDIMMPGMDGFSLIRSVRGIEALSDLPIVVLTARSDVEDLQEGFRMGADDFVSKPFQAEVLRARLMRLIHGRGRLQAQIRDQMTLPSGRVIARQDVPFMELAFRVVHENMGKVKEEFNVDVLAAEMGYSTSQLNRKLKMTIGLTAANFIKEQRLQHAKQLLEAGAGQVKWVVNEVGYQDASHFSHEYRERFGHLPSASKTRRSGESGEVG